MPLPTDPAAPWPPVAWRPVAATIDEAATWWEGDETRLAALYGGPTPSPSARPRRGLERIRFWARRADDQNTGRTRLHVPLPADLATTSADLLFGEKPAITIPDAHQTTAAPDATATEDRLAELDETDGISSTLLEAAEVCSAMGGVYLRTVWDTQVADTPMLDVVHADRAVPEFRWGRLIAVTLWRTVTHDRAAAVVWRHLERHEPGVIFHGLFEGSPERLGRPIGLDAHPDTAGLPEVLELPAALAGQLAVGYVPNVRPNRRHRGVPVGRADTAGTEALLDALDETWSSWMRDIRLGKARIIVPDEYLDRAGRGRGARADLDAEVFTPLAIDPTSADRAGITLTQFTLRTAEHAQTARALVEQIVTTAGYAPATFGLDTGGGEATATEVRAREARSLRTTMRKQAYWRSVVADRLEQALVLDREIWGRPTVPFRPRVDFADGLPDDPHRSAETLDLLVRAQAVSIETRVRLAQPGLDEAEVAAEVARILDETGMAVSDPTSGLSGLPG